MTTVSCRAYYSGWVQKRQMGWETAHITIDPNRWERTLQGRFSLSYCTRVYVFVYL